MAAIALINSLTNPTIVEPVTASPPATVPLEILSLLPSGELPFDAGVNWARLNPPPYDYNTIPWFFEYVVPAWDAALATFTATTSWSTYTSSTASAYASDTEFWAAFQAYLAAQTIFLNAFYTVNVADQTYIAAGSPGSGPAYTAYQAALTVWSTATTAWSTALTTFLAASVVYGDTLTDSIPFYAALDAWYPARDAWTLAGENYYAAEAVFYAAETVYEAALVIYDSALATYEASSAYVTEQAAYSLWVSQGSPESGTEYTTYIDALSTLFASGAYATFQAALAVFNPAGAIYDAAYQLMWGTGGAYSVAYGTPPSYSNGASEIYNVAISAFSTAVYAALDLQDADALVALEATSDWQTFAAAYATYIAGYNSYAAAYTADSLSAAWWVTYDNALAFAAANPTLPNVYSSVNPV